MDGEIKNILFWQISPSIHQAPYLRELSRQMPNANIICIFTRQIDDKRKRLGWNMPDYGGVRVFFENDSKRLIEIYHTYNQSSVNIFSSLMVSQLLRGVYLKCLRDKPLLVGVLSEGYNEQGFKGLLRKIRRCFYEKKLLRDVDFVLSIGVLSYDWFAKAGVDKRKIFAFPYVVDSKNEIVSQNSKKDVFKIVYVGALIKRKNVALLVSALSRIKSYPWELSIIGDGPERTNLEKQIGNLDLSNRITFMGSLNNAHVKQQLDFHDLLVLPSYWDGWGAVVNEALHQGLFVICSDKCGAGEVIRPNVNGNIFKSNSASDLARLLANYVNTGVVSNDIKSSIRNTVTGIEGISVAKYLLNIIDFKLDRLGKRPMPPWK